MSHPVFEPLRIGSLALRNRIVKAATYEGMVTGGLPSESLLRHHVELARGGVGMTTVAYCAVSDDGRTFQDQMTMVPQTVGPLRTLVGAVHREGAAAMLQLGHCGGFSKNEGLRPRGALGPSRGFNAYGLFKGIPFTRAMTEGDLHRISRDFARAAALAFDAGFDAVELHFGHGYLLSQFLSPARNHRKDAYGGSIENRMRFPRRVLAAVRDEVGAGAPLFAKMNLDDGVRNGLGVEDAVVVARTLEADGITGLVLSGGLVSHSAFYLLRGERPLRQMVEVEKSWPQKVAISMFGPLFVKKFSFEPLFFLSMARQVRASVTCPIIYLGGATSLEDLETVRAEGFDLIGMGRALIHDPDLPNKYAETRATTSGCQPCNLCITEMDRPGGVVCARQPWQLERRRAEVAAGCHVRVASEEHSTVEPPEDRETGPNPNRSRVAERERREPR